MSSKHSFLIILLVLSSCGKALPTLEGIDVQQWKDDKNACKGYRQSVELPMSDQLALLKGLSENDIVQLFGRPDQNELYKRNQKFYSYFVTPGPPCPNADSVSRKLILRFNAMGYAQAVSVE